MFTCNKCSGEGRIKIYGHIEGGICFKCNGRGNLPYNPDTTRFSGATDEQPEPDYDAYIRQQELAFWASEDEQQDARERQEFWEDNGFEAS